MERSQKITVVVAVRNRARQVVEALDSIASQTLLPDRVIVVDNGSTDGTMEAVEEWSRNNPRLPLTLTIETVSGAPAARNKGLSMVTTPFVAFFDSDDLMLSDHIERIDSFIDLVPEADLIYFDRTLRDENGWSKTIGSDDNDLLRAQILDCPLSTIGYVAATDLVRKAGEWETRLGRWNDYELGVRLVLESTKSRKLAGEPTVRIRQSADSISSRSYHESAHDLELALDLIILSLRRFNKLHEIKYVYARRAALAALYAREKAIDESRRLLDLALDSPPGGLRTLIALQLINLSVRLTGHGSSVLARLLIKEKKPRNRRKGL